MSTKWILSVTLLLCATMNLPTAHASTVADVQQRGELVVLCWPHQESIFVRRMVEMGREGLDVIGGLDVDVMTLYAKHLGVGLRVIPVRPDFASLIPSLLAEKGDALFRRTLGVLATSALTRGITDSGIAIGAAAALALGAWRFGQGELSLAALLVILMLGVEVFRPLRDLRDLLHDGMLAQSSFWTCWAAGRWLPTRRSRMQPRS